MTLEEMKLKAAAMVFHGAEVMRLERELLKEVELLTEGRSRFALAESALRGELGMNDIQGKIEWAFHKGSALAKLTLEERRALNL